MTTAVDNKELHLAPLAPANWIRLNLAHASIPSIIPEARMICPHCSAEMPEISAFCPACGRSVQENGDVGLPELHANSTRDNLLGALAYVALVPAIIFLVTPSLKASRFVRFHSWQSMFFAITALILAVCMRGLFAFFSLFPGTGFLLGVLASGLVFLALVFLWLVLVAKAVQGEAYEVPWLGHLAANLAK